MIGSPRSGSLPRSIAVGEAFSVALGRQISLELSDQQPAVCEDQDPERTRRLDKSCCGDRLARRGRVAEAVAANGAWILADEALVWLVFTLLLG